MDEQIMESLDEVILFHIEGLRGLDFCDSDEERRAVSESAIENFAKLYKLRQEDAKYELESKKSETEALAEENAMKTKLAEQKKDRAVKIVLEALAVGAPLIFYGIWMRRGFKFEETGTFTSSVFKGLFSRFRPTKN